MGKANMRICSKCGQEFKVILEDIRREADGIELIGEPVTVRAFMCPYCDAVFVVAVMTDEMIRNLKGTITIREFNKLEHEERKLRDKYIEWLSEDN